MGGVARRFSRLCVCGAAVALVISAGGGIANALTLPIPVAAFGSVASVNGDATPGTCGSAGASGTFTLMTRSGARALAVTATTQFIAPLALTPSFANVCVGRLVGAVGTLSDTTLNARLVVVPPPPPAATVGMVASVNGASTPGACGTAGAPGTFTITTRTGSQTVAVTATTKFVAGPVSTPSFANVCVNELAAAIGTASGATLNASRVIVWSPRTLAPVAAFGSVVSVNGDPTVGTCGTAGASGTFTLMTRSGARAVAVTATTQFLAPVAPSFAKVCVGRLVGAVGTLSGTTLNARLVVVPPPPPAAAVGMVASVNGASTPGACGTAGAPGTFTLTTRTGTRTVAVTATTTFVAGASLTPSFANVCVNGLAAAIGTAPGATLNATRVIIWSHGI